MVLPATVFDYDDAHVRIGLGRAPFREGLAVLEEWLAAGARPRRRRRASRSVG